MKTLTSLIYLLSISTIFSHIGSADSNTDKPSLLLANVYDHTIDVKNYFVSEKL